MARYRKIDVRMWGDKRFRRLSPAAPNGQTLWVFLLTGPHTNMLPGLFRSGEAALAEELGWELKGFREAFAEAFREGLVLADWKDRVVWVQNVVKYNKPESPNVVLAWRAAWDEIPECRLKSQAHQSLKAFLEGLGEAYAEAFAKACPKASVKPMPNSESESESEHEQEHEVLIETAKARARRPRKLPTDLSGFDDFWRPYPKKAGKLEAQGAWASLSVDDRQKAIYGSPLYAALVAGREPKHIKNPQGWLNGKRWEDETARPTVATPASRPNGNDAHGVERPIKIYPMRLTSGSVWHVTHEFLNSFAPRGLDPARELEAEEIDPIVIRVLAEKPSCRDEASARAYLRSAIIEAQRQRYENPVTREDEELQ